MSRMFKLWAGKRKIAICCSCYDEMKGIKVKDEVFKASFLGAVIRRSTNKFTHGGEERRKKKKKQKPFEK